MTQICDIRGPRCRPCPDDTPILNLSAEGPDLNVFVGIYDFPGEPPIDHEYSNLGCKTWCYSTVSQAEADLCAQQQAELCYITNNGPNNPGCKSAGVCGNDDTPPVVYYSKETICREQCPDNPATEIVLQAGFAISSISQADADAKALSWCSSYGGFATTCCLIDTDPDLPDGQVGVDYSQFITASSIQLPVNWFLTSGFLPDGLTLDQTTGEISGVPGSNDEFTFTITAIGHDGVVCLRDFTIFIGNSWNWSGFCGEVSNPILPDGSNIPGTLVMRQAGFSLTTPGAGNCTFISFGVPAQEVEANGAKVFGPYETDKHFVFAIHTEQGPTGAFHSQIIFIEYSVQVGTFTSISPLACALPNPNAIYSNLAPCTCPYGDSAATWLLPAGSSVEIAGTIHATDPTAPFNSAVVLNFDITIVDA